MCPLSAQDNNEVIRTFYPKDPNGDSAPPVKGGALTMKEGILSHHEVMYRLGMLEMERGAFTHPLLTRDVMACSSVRPLAHRNQGRWPPWLLPHGRRSRPQPGLDLLRSLVPPLQGVQEGAAAVLHEQGHDGQDGTARRV